MSGGSAARSAMARRPKTTRLAANPLLCCQLAVCRLYRCRAKARARARRRQKPPPPPQHPPLRTAACQSAPQLRWFDASDVLCLMYRYLTLIWLATPPPAPPSSTNARARSTARKLESAVNMRGYILFCSVRTTLGSEPRDPLGWWAAWRWYRRCLPLHVLPWLLTANDVDAQPALWCQERCVEEHYGRQEEVVGSSCGHVGAQRCWWWWRWLHKQRRCTSPPTTFFRSNGLGQGRGTTADRG